ncbi:type II secretion system protein GspL [Caulobacter vibrioides]|uniref:General secretion pathway protein L, putative n=2 Tax=Caulobacter vibrioides TaxID=155892 RepID=Q9ABP5_CAUVC|nr:type II secretion system protein GspL [Caulobacter vibrioides]YP_002515555.1 type II secretion pathway protein L [Caulobacter vibrioides NA1000]AAK22168.1 general secretion pathway protein L, putative [Caulobacter vibrioides CB15]ACL93647.1 type II secretion pathway protein L [Caulobacter vibrioides NA1000]ATC23198.1 type II secretion system protein GspL [Caulobacter vibrioides]ATC27015.1 type II secretion system protein GspL [Caulobacter vibrioides]AZH11406.1 type II secretion system prot
MDPRRMTLLSLLILPAAPDEPAQLLQDYGLSVTRRTLAPDERLDEVGAVILVAPGEEVVARWMDLPMGSAAQARSAAAFRLEDEVALGAEDLHIAVGEADAAGRTLVVWTARDKLQAWLDMAQTHGLAPQAVIPDYLLLPEAEDGVLTVGRLGARLALREPSKALSADADLAALLFENREHRYLAGKELDAQLITGARAPVINLLQGRFAVRTTGGRGGLRRLAILTAAAVLSPLLLMIAQIAHDQWTARALERQATKLAVSLAPQASRYEDAVGYALSRLAASQSGQGFGDLSASYLSMVESTPGVTLDTLVYGEEGAIRSTIVYNNYSDMDQLRLGAKRLGLELTEQSTASEGGRISSDLIIRRKP